MNGTLETITRSAAVAADWADVMPLSAFEEATFKARENALFANGLKEWWDEFWHKYALTAARKKGEKYERLQQP